VIQVYNWNPTVSAVAGGRMRFTAGGAGRALIGWPVQDWLRLGVVKGVDGGFGCVDRLRLVGR
jgi:hypothetical protein